MRFIKLTRNKISIVDDEDFIILSNIKGEFARTNRMLGLLC